MDILKYKTIVIKIGSSLIVDGKNRIKKNWFNKLIEDINFLIQKNKQIIIVSSGAIALGCDLLKINKMVLFTINLTANYFALNKPYFRIQ